MGRNLLIGPKIKPYFYRRYSANPQLELTTSQFFYPRSGSNKTPRSSQ